MPLLPSIEWRTSYRHEDGDLVRGFFIPALSCAVQYDRMTGYFSAETLALAARGIHELIRNGGRMRLIVGCTLDADECEALEAGYCFREDPSGYFSTEVAKRLQHISMDPPTENAKEALGGLAWLIANNLLDVKVAVPVDPESGRPVKAPGIYHEKVGVITDVEGNRLCFSGSINETESGWLNNRESFHVHCSWEGGREWKHVEDEVESFARLWEGRARSVRTVDFPEAAKERLLEFLPDDDRFVAPPAAKPRDPEPIPAQDQSGVEIPRFTPSEKREIVWTFVHNAARLANGIRVGEMTSAVTPWPHQQRAFVRMWNRQPIRMLESSEVGLGKTTIAALVLRQLLLSRRAKSILIMVPKAVMQQWVGELYEKFGLHVPIYDGRMLVWRPVKGYNGPLEKEVGRTGWFGETIVIASSHLMRRKDRAKDLLSHESGWDMVILDEAHHARRRGAGSAQEKGPNTLLALMQQLAPKAKNLLLLTATPMQIHPVEVYDLIKLLGLPEEWDAVSFVRYFELAASENPSNDDLAWLARMFRATESFFGEASEEEVAAAFSSESRLNRRKVLKALRDASSNIPLRQLNPQQRRLAQALCQRFSPVRHRMSRYTRALLRRYFQEGLISACVADREVHDRMIEMSKAEERLYKDVEDYISSTYDAASQKEKNAVGFILTVYRRRLASSVHALKKTLLRRLEGLILETNEEDLPQDETADEVLSAEDAQALASEGLKLIEADDIKILLKQIEKVGVESKAKRLGDELEALLVGEYDSAIIFTQYTDTMDWLAEYLAQRLPDYPIGTYSGAGGRIRDKAGSWLPCTKEQVKMALKTKRIRLLLATDAAGEGLNLQFCGVLVNYDQPYSPLKIEQRIGRLDRIGQKHKKIVILNLAYKDTVEADVYFALGNRINLFEGVVGKLQPILSRLPKRLEEAALARPEVRASVRERFLADLENEITEAEAGAFDIDEVATDDLVPPHLPASPLTAEDLEYILNHPELLPNGWESSPLDQGSFALRRPGCEMVRATARGTLFDDHPDSMAFFSVGAPCLDGTDVGLAEGAVSLSVNEEQHVIMQLTADQTELRTFSDVIAAIET
jgi:superfamily II DNA or RNA helicase